MKIVFLDFDGVLNNFGDGFDDRVAGSSTLAREHLDPTNVGNLNDLIARTGAKVVVSSSWRILDPIEELIRILRHHGFNGEAIGVTPRLHRTPEGEPRYRGHEIQAWIDDQEEKPLSFVILDDSSDMAHLMERLVKTNNQLGLTPADVERAIEILNKDLP